MKVRKKNKARAVEIVGSMVEVELPPFARPKFADSLKWPNNLSTLRDANVSELIGQYTELLCYVDAQLCKIQQEIMATEQALNKHRTYIYTEEHSILSLDKNKREMKLDSDSGIATLKSSLVLLKRREAGTALYVRNYERMVWALSRELSRQTGSGERSRFPRIGRE